MEKRGQVTIFIILGILVIAGVTIFFVVRNMQGGNEINNPELSPVQELVDSCLASETLRGTELISNQGGFYSVPEPSFDYNGFKIPVYSKFPEKSVLEKQLSLYLENNLPLCLENNTLSGQGYAVSFSKPSVTSKFLDNTILISSKIPTSITFKENSYTFSSYEYTARSDLSERYSAASLIYNKQNQEINLIPLGYLTILSYKNNFTYSLDLNQPGLILYKLSFKKGSYFFAVKSNNYSNFAETGPYSGDIPTAEIKIAKDGKIYLYDLTSFIEGSSFYAYSPFLNVSDGGLLKFNSSIFSSPSNIFLVKTIKEGTPEFFYLKITVDENSLKPVLENIPDQYAESGKLFSYTIKAYDPSNSFIKFSDNTNLFSIESNSGKISFTPNSPGEYVISITASNKFGGTTKFLKLLVK
ncbi:Uncharacterised protein [uncultured archaeon]|nr:Uncharacterised protein [uncultured archaeon]